MAEQINKNDYINHPDRIGGFNYYSWEKLPLSNYSKTILFQVRQENFKIKSQMLL